MGEEEVRVWQTSASESPGWVHVKLFEGIKTKLKLRADLQVKFREAFTENALCKVSREPFDVDLKDEEGEHVAWLSELPPNKAKSELGRAVRRSEPMEEGCRRFVADLLRRRQFQPDAAGIVYCGNDTDKDDPQVNKHANNIRRLIQRLAPSLHIPIVTAASTEDGSDVLQQFQDGRYDGVIVKQMAGMGLDVPRVKVGLDLSPTRTFASLVQRMMRPATPYSGSLVCTWITPDDIMSKAIFKRLVQDQGGEATVAALDLVREYDKEKEDGPDQPPLFAGGTNLADFEDTDGNEARAERWSTAVAVMTEFPILMERYSAAEIATRLHNINATVADEAAPTVVDSSVMSEALRGDINELAQDYTRRFMSFHGIPYPKYGETIQEVWVQAYRQAGWPWGTRLNDIIDLQKLEDVREALEQMSTRLWREHGK
jgi:hypothetical protein